MPLSARAVCSLCLGMGLYSNTENKGSARVMCKVLSLMPRWLGGFFLCAHAHTCMPKQRTCLSVRAAEGALAWGWVCVCGWPPPQHPSQSLSQREQLLPWGPRSLFQAAAAFPKLTPLLQLLIFLLGGHRLAGEGSPEDSAPSRQADLPQTLPPAVHPLSSACDSSDSVTGYQSVGCVTPHVPVCVCICVCVCVRERERDWSWV